MRSLCIFETALGLDVVVGIFQRPFQTREFIEQAWFITSVTLMPTILVSIPFGAVISLQDMGAAGLTSLSVEMASKGGVGLLLNMDDVPQREEGMTPYEMMLSESQERMLMVLKPGREDFAAAIFHKWELDFAVIGHVTSSRRPPQTGGHPAAVTPCRAPAGSRSRLARKPRRHA